MHRTFSERIASGVAYAVTLAGVILILTFVMLNEWAPRVVLILGVASVAMVALCWRSRYALAHAINALMLSVLTMLLSTVPLLVATALRHGYLLPRPVGPKQMWVDPVPGVLAVTCILIGVPLLFITFEALADSLKGEFMDNWPPLRWLEDRLVDRT